ncbi:hypothetical protein [Neobacillus bataviensis]|uniref:hypothetical protein n=1 Tax=Neobacillus bataviensis TaxID=220685 RepID=UPI0002E27448|nr:hypothetical protein [Neobacillus bataviensis]
MKYSNLSLDRLLGSRFKARHKVREYHNLEQQFEQPIIHREIQGNRVYVPLNVNRVWNEV